MPEQLKPGQVWYNIPTNQFWVTFQGGFWFCVYSPNFGWKWAGEVSWRSTIYIGEL